MTCGPHGDMSTCGVGAVLADAGPRVYQWACSGRMVSVLVFGITRGFTFTRTTLTASFSLHDRVFDKVQAPHPPPQGLRAHRYVSQWGLWITCHVPDTVLSSGGDAAHGAYSRVWEESPSI